MSRNSARIESIGITKLEDFIQQSKLLHPYLDKNDRTPSWDGYIFVYKFKDGRKENLKGRIPVQVKTTSIKKQYTRKTKKLSISIADLNNYKNEGGILCFNVLLLNNNLSVYCAKLLPVELKRILDQKQHQKTVSIEFKVLDDIHSLYILCLDFLLHRPLQGQIDSFHQSFESNKVLTIKGIFSSKDSLFRDLLNKPQYIYGKSVSSLSVFDYAEKVNIKEIIQKVVRPITFNGVQYYSGYKIINSQNQSKIIVSNDLQFETDDSGFKINYHPTGNLDYRINDINFLIKFVMSTPNDSFQRSEAFKRISNYKEFLDQLGLILDVFDICHNDFLFEDFFYEDERQLNILVDTLLKNDYRHFENIESGFKHFKLGNINLYAIYIKAEVSKLYEFNECASSTSLSVVRKLEDNTIKCEHFQISFYLTLTKEILINVSNINLETALDNIMKFSHNDVYDQYTLLFSLELIKSFDETKKNVFLDFADKLFNWLDKGFLEEKLIRINKLQIVYRKRALNSNEKKWLSTALRTEKDISFKCGLFILLKKKNDFHSMFGKLSSKKKEEFKAYPIFTLVNK